MRYTIPTANTVLLNERPSGVAHVILEEDIYPTLFVSVMTSQSINSFAFSYPLNIYSDRVHVMHVTHVIPVNL